MAWNAAIGAGAASAAVFDGVVARHREAHRRYHGVRHVTWVVRHVGDLGADVPLADPGAVLAAAFFHDAVYDPRAADNEEQSARLAERVLAELGWDPGRAAAVGAMVRATAAHGAPPDDDTAVLLDADLAVLGADAGDYDRYAGAIRREYAWVPEEDYRRGRGRVLRQFLQRERIYRLESVHRALDSRARENLRRELGSLGEL